MILQQVRQLLQPHAVFVPDNHCKYVIHNVPKSVDAEALVATLAEGEFKPYLIASALQGNSKKKLVIAAEKAPVDVVIPIALKDASFMVVLQLEKSQDQDQKASDRPKQ